MRISQSRSFRNFPRQGVDGITLFTQISYFYICSENKLDTCLLQCSLGSSQRFARLNPTTTTGPRQELMHRQTSSSNISPFNSDEHWLTNPHMLNCTMKTLTWISLMPASSLMMSRCLACISIICFFASLRSSTLIPSIDFDAQPDSIKSSKSPISDSVPINDSCRFIFSLHLSLMICIQSYILCELKDEREINLSLKEA